MKLGVMAVLFPDKPLKETLEYLSSQGVQAIELGTGGFPGDAYLKPAELLGNKAKTDEILKLIDSYGITISALSCHGNPVHPNKAIAESYHKQFENNILLAEQMGVDTVNGFSGCPGDSSTSQHPNWVTCPWPPEFLDVLDYQWNEVLIPYWQKMGAFAKEHGVNKIAFEMHPGFCVYNPETLLRLREAVGDVIGANFDPSHLFWQGIDPVVAIRELKGAIYHFHAKDTRIDRRNCDVNGVLDTKHYSKIAERAWVFRSVGYGHDYQVWKDMISMLRTIGYDGAVSIEHEDSLMSPTEGLEKAIAFLKNVLAFEDAGEMWWA